MDSLSRVAKIIENDIISIVREIMSSDAMKNHKGKNTIAPDSDLFKEIKTKVRNDGDIVFDLMLNAYIKYVEDGRRPYGKILKGEKLRKKFPPIQPIIQWAQKKGIPTDNNTIYAIRYYITSEGIKPRPIMAKVFERMDKVWENEWSDRIYNEIISEIENWFNGK